MTPGREDSEPITYASTSTADIVSPALHAHPVRSALAYTKLACTRLVHGITKAQRKLHQPSPAVSALRVGVVKPITSPTATHQSVCASTACPPEAKDDSQLVTANTSAPPVYIPPLPTFLRDIFGPMVMSASDAEAALVLGCSPKPPCWRRSSVFSVFPREASDATVVVVANRDDEFPSQRDHATRGLALVYAAARECDEPVPTIALNPGTAVRSPLPSQNEDVVADEALSDTHGDCSHVSLRSVAKPHLEVDTDVPPGDDIDPGAEHNPEADDSSLHASTAITFASIFAMFWKRLVMAPRVTAI